MVRWGLGAVRTLCGGASELADWNVEMHMPVAGTESGREGGRFVTYLLRRLRSGALAPERPRSKNGLLYGCSVLKVRIQNGRKSLKVGDLGKVA